MKNLAKRLRQDAKISQLKMAATVGKCVDTIKRWERGASMPGFSDVVTVCRKYDLDISRYMLTDEEILEMQRRLGTWGAAILNGRYLDPGKIKLILEGDWEKAEEINRQEIACERAKEIFEIGDRASYGEMPPERMAEVIFSQQAPDSWSDLEAEIVANLQNLISADGRAV